MNKRIEATSFIEKARSVARSWLPFLIPFVVLGFFAVRTLMHENEKNIIEVPPEECGVDTNAVYFCEFKILTLNVSPLVTLDNAKTVRKKNTTVTPGIVKTTKEKDVESSCYFLLGDANVEIFVPVEACQVYMSLEEYRKKVEMCKKYSENTERPPCVAEDMDYEVAMQYEKIGGRKYHTTEICVITVKKDGKKLWLYSLEACLSEKSK